MERRNHIMLERLLRVLLYSLVGIAVGIPLFGGILYFVAFLVFGSQLEDKGVLNAFEKNTSTHITLGETNYELDGKFFIWEKEYECQESADIGAYYYLYKRGYVDSRPAFRWETPTRYEYELSANPLP